FFFFFQSEDGIPDFHVTGVQTSALPICPAHLLDGDNVLQIAEPQPAIRLRDSNAVQAKVAHLWPQLTWEAVLAIDRLRQGLDRLVGKPTNRFADHRRLIAQSEVEIWRGAH